MLASEHNPMTSKRLTPEQVQAVGIAALENAVEMMGEAEILLDADRPRRAFALGVTAAEEIAKTLACRSALGRWTGTLTVAELNKALRPPRKAHAERYATALAYLTLVSGAMPPPAGFEREDMKARNRVLYVEVAPDGSAMTPEGVSEDEARMWVTGMIRNFTTLASAWRAGLDDDLAIARGEQEPF
jgi:AbiV family abortive infection protein